MPKRRPAGDEFDVGVHHPHRSARLGRPATVVRRRRVPDLPWSVHLVAQTPGGDPIWVRMPVCDPLGDEAGIRAEVAVLHELRCRPDPCGAKVHRHHRVQSAPGRPRQELVQPDQVRLDGTPGEVQTGWPLSDRADPVPPVVAGDEIPTRVAHSGHSQLGDELGHVTPETRRIRGRMVGLVDAGVHAPAHVLDEAAEDPGIDVAMAELGVNGDGGRGVGQVSSLSGE